MGSRSNNRRKRVESRAKPETNVSVRRPAQRQNIGRSTFGVARVRKEVSNDLVGIIHSPANPLPTKRKALEVDTIPDVSSATRAPRPEPKTERNKPNESKLELRQERTCKTRPRNNRGNGKSRRFIKWCS